MVAGCTPSPIIINNLMYEGGGAQISCCWYWISDIVTAWIQPLQTYHQVTLASSHFNMILMKIFINEHWLK